VEVVDSACAAVLELRPVRFEAFLNMRFLRPGGPQGDDRPRGRLAPSLRSPKGSTGPQSALLYVSQNGTQMYVRTSAAVSDLWTQKQIPHRWSAFGMTRWSELVRN